jgi:hypothetical protein
MKKIASSKYKGVCKVKCRDSAPWLMRVKINGLTSMKRYTTEEDAAKAYDMVCLVNNLPAKNFYTKTL